MFNLTRNLNQRPMTTMAVIISVCVLLALFLATVMSASGQMKPNHDSAAQPAQPKNTKPVTLSDGAYYHFRAIFAEQQLVQQRAAQLEKERVDVVTAECARAGINAAECGINFETRQISKQQPAPAQPTPASTPAPAQTPAPAPAPPAPAKK